MFPKEQKPKADDMPAMAEFFTRLENFTEMDASILRATRIHKLPKAIMRLETIPREEEFDFKTRSAGLLDKWNKILADAPPAEGASGGVNGAGEAKESNDAKTGRMAPRRPRRRTRQWRRRKPRKRATVTPRKRLRMSPKR